MTCRSVGVAPALVLRGHPGAGGGHGVRGGPAGAAGPARRAAARASAPRRALAARHSAHRRPQRPTLEHKEVSTQ